MPEFNYDRAATILVESAFYGDAKTAHKFGLSTRTVRKYRFRMNTDKKLYDLFVIRKQQFENDWAACLSKAIRAGVEFIIRAAGELDTTEAENVHAIAAALKVVAEIELAKKIVDVKLSRINQFFGNNEEPGDHQKYIKSTEN